MCNVHVPYMHHSWCDGMRRVWPSDSFYSVTSQAIYVMTRAYHFFAAVVPSETWSSHHKGLSSCALGDLVLSKQWPQQFCPRRPGPFTTRVSAVVPLATWSSHHKGLNSCALDDLALSPQGPQQLCRRWPDPLTTRATRRPSCQDQADIFRNCQYFKHNLSVIFCKMLYLTFTIIFGVRT